VKFNSTKQISTIEAKKILFATDAWFPQTNGEVTTLAELKKQLEKLGHEIFMVTPQDFIRIPCPTYSEISLAVNAWYKF
jgi:glycine/D-amino acid oxidase-like deaminating enzyme